MYATLREFVEALERAGELRRVRARVDPVLEIAAITDRISKGRAPHPPSESAKRCDQANFDRGGPALLFENVVGSSWPVLINAFGSYRRMEIALGCHDAAKGLAKPRVPGGFEGIAARIGGLVKPQPPKSAGELISRARQLAPLLRIPPRLVGQGRCQQVVVLGEDVNLLTMPMIRCWPLDGDLASVGYPADVNAGIEGPFAEDGSGAASGGASRDVSRVTRDEWNRLYRGRYITFAGIHTIHADEVGEDRPSSHNIGMYRVQLLGPRRMVMHWHTHHDGAAHWRSWKRRGSPMPVAIAFGGESVLPYAATAPLPPGMSELLMAGFLNGRGIPLVRCKTVPLRVPANAEIVIEGWVSHDAGEINYDPRRDGRVGPGAAFEGPFGDHTGFYSLPDRYPILDVSAVTHARNPIYPTTIVGLPPQEDYYMGKATERIFLPLLRTLIPDIVDYDLPMFGAFHNCAFVKIRKEYPLHARRVMHAIWGAGQMAWTKCIVVVDEDVDVHDVHTVLSAVGALCDPGRDVEVVHGPLDILDHAAPWLGAGTKFGLDATRKRPGEEVGGSPLSPPRPRADEGQARAFLDAMASVEGVDDAVVARDLGDWAFVRMAGGKGSALLDRLEGRKFEWAPPMLIVAGADVNIDDPCDALFHWLANIDAGRDMRVMRLATRETLAFDATPKRPGDPARLPIREWPPILRMTEEIAQYVESRWGGYGLD